MKNVKIEVTPEELLLVTTLLSDQLFRLEFIDPKMPGHKVNLSELAMGKDLVVRLRLMAREASGLAVAAASRRAASDPPPHRNGASSAV